MEKDFLHFRAMGEERNLFLVRRRKGEEIFPPKQRKMKYLRRALSKETPHHGSAPTIQSGLPTSPPPSVSSSPSLSYFSSTSSALRSYPSPSSFLPCCHHFSLSFSPPRQLLHSSPSLLHTSVLACSSGSLIRCVFTPVSLFSSLSSLVIASPHTPRTRVSVHLLPRSRCSSSFSQLREFDGSPLADTERPRLERRSHRMVFPAYLRRRNEGSSFYSISPIPGHHLPPSSFFLSLSPCSSLSFCSSSLLPACHISSLSSSSSSFSSFFFSPLTLPPNRFTKAHPRSTLSSPSSSPSSSSSSPPSSPLLCLLRVSPTEPRQHTFCPQAELPPVTFHSFFPFLTSSRRFACREKSTSACKKECQRGLSSEGRGRRHSKVYLPSFFKDSPSTTTTTLPLLGATLESQGEEGEKDPPDKDSTKPRISQIKDRGVQQAGEEKRLFTRLQSMNEEGQDAEEKEEREGKGLRGGVRKRVGDLRLSIDKEREEKAFEALREEVLRRLKCLHDVSSSPSSVGNASLFRSTAERVVEPFLSALPFQPRDNIHSHQQCEREGNRPSIPLPTRLLPCPSSSPPPAARNPVNSLFSAPSISSSSSPPVSPSRSPGAPMNSFLSPSSSSVSPSPCHRTSPLSSVSPSAYPSSSSSSALRCTGYVMIEEEMRNASMREERGGKRLSNPLELRIHVLEHLGLASSSSFSPFCRLDFNSSPFSSFLQETFASLREYLLSSIASSQAKDRGEVFHAVEGEKEEEKKKKKELLLSTMRGLSLLHLPRYLHETSLLFLDMIEEQYSQLIPDRALSDADLDMLAMACHFLFLCRVSCMELLDLLISPEYLSRLSSHSLCSVLDAVSISEDEHAILQLREHLPLLEEKEEDHSFSSKRRDRCMPSPQRKEVLDRQVAVKAFAVLAKAFDGEVDLAEDILHKFLLPLQSERWSLRHFGIYTLSTLQLGLRHFMRAKERQALDQTKSHAETQEEVHAGDEVSHKKKKKDSNSIIRHRSDRETLPGNTKETNSEGKPSENARSRQHDPSYTPSSSSYSISTPSASCRHKASDLRSSPLSSSSSSPPPPPTLTSSSASSYYNEDGIPAVSPSSSSRSRSPVSSFEIATSTGEGRRKNIRVDVRLLGGQEEKVRRQLDSYQPLLRLHGAIYEELISRLSSPPSPISPIHLDDILRVLLLGLPGTYIQSFPHQRKLAKRVRGLCWRILKTCASPESLTTPQLISLIHSISLHSLLSTEADASLVSSYIRNLDLRLRPDLLHAENTLRLSEAASVISKMKDSYSDWIRSEFFISSWPVFEAVLSTYQHHHSPEKEETETRGLNSETGSAKKEDQEKDERSASVRLPRNHVELRTLLNLAASLKSLQCGDPKPWRLLSDFYVLNSQPLFTEMLLESQRQHSHAASPRPPAYPSPPPSFSPFSSSSTDLRNLSSSSSLSSSLSSSTSFSSSSSSVVSFSGVSASLSLIHPRLGSNPMPSFGVPESIVARRIERSFLLPWVRGAVLVLRHSLQLTGEMQSLYPLADMIFACLLDRRRRRPHGYSLLEALPHGVILEALQSLCLLRYHRRRASDFDLLLECLAGLPSPLLALDKGGALALWTAYDILRYEGGASISWRMGSIPTRRGRNPLADAVKIQPSDLHKLFVSFKRDCQDIALDVSAHFKRYGVQHCLWPHERTTGGLPLAIQLFLPSPPSHASRFEGGGGEGRHRSFPSLSFSSSFDARTCNSSSAFQDCISHEKETPLPGVPVPYSTSPKKTNKKVREEECLSQERPHLHTSRQNRNFPSQLSCVAREPSYSSFSSSTLQHPPLRSSLSSSSTVSLSSQPSLARDASVASSSRDDRQGSGDTRCGLLILPQEVISRRHLDGRPFLLLRSFVYHACKQATASSSFRGGVQEVNTDVRRRRRQQEEDSPSPSSSSSLLHVTYGYGDIIGGLERRGWEKILILIEGEWRDACKANERDQLLLRLLMEAGVDVSSSSSLLQQPGFNERQADTSSYSPQPKLAFSSRCLYTHQGGSVDGPRRHNPPSHHLHL